MIYVIDASAGVEIALNRSSAARFNELLVSASRIITSDFYKAETASALWKYHKAAFLSKEEVLETHRYCEQIIDDFVDLSVNSEESLAESMRLNHPACDLFYLTLARRRGAVLLTMDRKLKKLAMDNGVDVVD